MVSNDAMPIERKMLRYKDKIYRKCFITMMLRAHRFTSLIKSNGREGMHILRASTLDKYIDGAVMYGFIPYDQVELHMPGHYEMYTKLREKETMVFTTWDTIDGEGEEILMELGVFYAVPFHKFEEHGSALAFVCDKIADCICIHCKELCNPEDIKKCGVCKKARYCSKDCQRAHWSIHKCDCKASA